MPTVFPDVDFIFCPADGLLSASGRTTTPHDPITRGIPRMVFGRGVHIFGVEFVRRQSRYGSQPVLAGGEYFQFVFGQKPDDFLRSVDAGAFRIPRFGPAYAIIPEYLPDRPVGAVFEKMDGSARLMR